MSWTDRTKNYQLFSDCLLAYKLHRKYKKGGKQSATHDVNEEYLPIEKRKSFESKEHQAIYKHAKERVFAKSAPLHFFVRGDETFVFVGRWKRPK